MAAEKSDEPGVLGNLPRSRPGQRSDKRGGARAAAGGPPADAAAGPSRSASEGKAAGAGPSRRAKTGGAKPARARATPSSEPPRAEQGRPETEAHGPTDPLTGAVRLAGKLAEAGFKTAGDLLRRLPGR